MILIIVWKRPRPNALTSLEPIRFLLIKKATNSRSVLSTINMSKLPCIRLCICLESLSFSHGSWIQITI